MNADVLTTILGVSLLVFVITSMLAMGLSLSMAQILAPLREGRLVTIAIAANFAVVPLLAWGLGELFGLSEGLRIGLILMGTAAGAPFLPKLGEIAKGNIAFSVGLMVMRLWDGLAHQLRPLMGTISSVAIALLVVSGIVANWSSIVGIIGTGGLMAILLFLAVSFLIGFVGGGSDPAIKSVLGLGTAQRNLSAAFVVALQNFSDNADVLTLVIVGGMVGLAVLIPLAAELGKRQPQKAVSA